MLKYLSTLDLVLWFIIAAGQIALAALARRRKVAEMYPAFTLFIYFSAITTPVLMMLRGLDYFWGYYAQSFVALTLMALSAAEIYRKVYGPRISLPSWIPRNVSIWLLSSLLACAVPVVWLRPVNGGSYTLAMNASQSALMAMLCASLLILVGYAKWLRMYFRPWAQGIAYGLILCLTINTLTMFLAGLVRNMEIVNIVQDIGQAGYLLAMASWGWSIWHREPGPEEITPRMLSKILEFHGETKDAARLVS